MKARTQQPFELTGRHVILGFVAFFAVLIAVQAAFITIAISTHTGLVSKQPYRKGLKYGERIAQAQRQEKLGWSETLEVSKADHTLTLHITDQYGKPVRGLHLAASIGRGVTNTQDRVLTFEAATNGAYKAKLPAGLAGTYITDIEASNNSSGGEPVWRMRKRLWIEP